MPPSDVLWTRLVRYIATSGHGNVQYGEPVVSSSEEFDDLLKAGKLQVRVCEGSDPFSARPTEQIQTVRTLLGPLRPEDVPIIRCIGLNYKTHSQYEELL
jgi:hypothetical protein